MRIILEIYHSSYFLYLTLVSRKELNKNNTYRGKKRTGPYPNKRWYQ
jgi:hypothetical protein